jgi:CheY-like chemotaxis protein
MGGKRGSGLMRVLIVDDNEGLTALMKDMLETEGICHVETAENGEDGYLAFLHFKPDIILTDIEMPVKSGLEMVKEIRVHHPGIKTIYMSGDMNRYRLLLEKEETEYKANLLDKPFSFSKVIGLFNEYQEKERV